MAFRCKDLNTQITTFEKYLKNSNGHEKATSNILNKYIQIQFKAHESKNCTYTKLLSIQVINNESKEGYSRIF